jgi:oligoribonuclease NrnB/cAMP/cGMP phosphodiesterase (DHH superfamily)
MKTTVLYHADCVDGFTAAWAAWLKFGSAAEYIPVRYGEEPPDVTGQDVWVLDFWYPRKTLLAMAEIASSITVLDHHLTGRDELVGLQFAVFDMKRSGARLTWDTLYPDTPRPRLIDYVEDRDLWRFGLPESHAVTALVGTWPRDDLVLWSSLANLVEDGFGAVIDQGKAVLRKIEQTVKYTAKHARLLVVSGSLVPVVNVTSDTSDVVGHLAETTAFAVGWYQRADGKYAYSLRSRGEGGVDVAELAKQRGGGGHRNAAGFEADHGPDVLFSLGDEARAP